MLTENRVFSKRELTSGFMDVVTSKPLSDILMLEKTTFFSAPKGLL